jgi:hypothetical protein
MFQPDGKKEWPGARILQAEKESAVRYSRRHWGGIVVEHGQVMNSQGVP